MSRLRRLAGLGCAAGVALTLAAALAPAPGQQRARPPVPPVAVPEADVPPAPTGPRGENFSAKPAPQLFASDCTGAGCHRGPQGLAKGQSPSGLTGFLRQHYTNSQQSAAALAAYLASVAGAPVDARPTRQKTDRTKTPAEPNGTPKHDQRKTTARPHKGKQATVEPTNVPAAPAAVPTAPVASDGPTAAAPPPPAPPAPPPAPKSFDIFD